MYNTEPETFEKIKNDCQYRLYRKPYIYILYNTPGTEKWFYAELIITQ